MERTGLMVALFHVRVVTIAAVRSSTDTATTARTHQCISTRKANPPSHCRTTDAHIQALPSGTIFIDTGQNANNCCMLRIKL